MIPAFPADLVSAAVAIAIAALLAGLARGFSGFGAALIFVPIASAAVGPVVALPVLLLADIVTSSQFVRKVYRYASWTEVRGVAMAALIGLPIGNYVLTAANPVAVRWAVVVLIFLSLAVMISGYKFKTGSNPRVAAAVGLVSGLMSGLAQIGGPPVVMYWLSAQPDTVRMRANLVIYFAIMMWTALCIFLAKGLVTGTVLWLAAAAAPAYALGMVAGARLFGLASPETFRRISIALVALATVLGLPALDPYLKWGG